MSVYLNYLFFPSRQMLPAPITTTQPFINWLADWHCFNDYFYFELNIL